MNKYIIRQGGVVINAILAENEAVVDAIYDESYTYEEVELDAPVDIEGPKHDHNWEALTNTLRQSSAWARVYGASTISLACNTAFTLLLTTLTKTNNLDDLRFSLVQLRASLVETPLGDFNEEEIEFLKSSADYAGFNYSELGF